MIFIGAVHDFSTLVASVRHDARSIAEVVEARTSAAQAWLAMLAFIWLALVYVIVAFVDVTAGTFVTGEGDSRGIDVRLQPGRRGRARGVALPRARAS